MRRGAGGLALLALAAALPAAAASGLGFDGNVGAGYDSNIGNAATFSDDKRGVASVYGGVGANYNWPFTLYTALNLRAGLAAEGVTDLQKLSNGLGDLRLRLLHKPGEGFYVPVLAAWGSAGYRASASDIRSGSEWRAGAYLMEPVTTQIQARAGFSWLGRDSVSRVFDGEIRSYELNIDWAPVPGVTVYGGYRLDRGPLVVSADGHGDGSVTPKTEHLVLRNVADRIEPDTAFGDSWFAFRVNGRTGIAALGANVLLSKDWSIDGQARYADAKVDYPAYSGGGPGPGSGYSGVSYKRWIGGLSLLVRFGQ